MISMIAAVAANGVIGRQGRIPFSEPEDRAHFRTLTMGSSVIMGRRTYEEIGHPLPGRYHVIVSGTLHLHGDNLCTAATLPEAIRKAAVRENVFLCGGTRIYAEGMAYAERIYLTELKAAYEGDVYFPPMPPQFRLIERVERERLYFSVYAHDTDL